MPTVRLVLVAMCGLAGVAAAQGIGPIREAQVERVLAPDGRGCAFFRMRGVAVVDPALSPSNEFAINVGRPDFAEVYALLLTAASSRATVRAASNQRLECGLPGTGLLEMIAP